jgi:hypothetical protein
MWGLSHIGTCHAPVRSITVYFSSTLQYSCHVLQLQTCHHLGGQLTPTDVCCVQIQPKTSITKFV